MNGPRPIALLACLVVWPASAFELQDPPEDVPEGGDAPPWSGDSEPPEEPAPPDEGSPEEPAPGEPAPIEAPPDEPAPDEPASEPTPIEPAPIEPPPVAPPPALEPTAPDPTSPTPEPAAAPEPAVDPVGEPIPAGDLPAIETPEEPPVEDPEGELYFTRAWTPEELSSARIAADDLLSAASVHGLDTRWIAAHVFLPGGQASMDRWQHALRAFGPVETVLVNGDGVGEIVEGPDYLRAILQTDPVLSVVLRPDSAGSMRIVTVDATACTRCDERRRFVEDLIAQVRRTGKLGERLLPDLELRIPGGGGRSSDWWSAMQEARTRADESVADAIAGATVVASTGEVVRVRYANGDEDQWHIVRTPRGWGLAYDGLSASSPLRMSQFEARKWRKLSTRQDVAAASWTPTWRSVGMGAGVVVGHHVIAGAFDPHDDTILLVTVDRDVPTAGVFRVDPVLQSVTGRWRIALPDIDDAPGNSSSPSTWRVAFDPTLRHVALMAFGKVWDVDTASASPREVTRSKTLSAITWDDAGRLYWATSPTALSGPSDAPARPAIEGSLAMGARGAWTSAVTEAGEVVTWRAGVPEPQRAVACPYGAGGASQNPANGSWLVSCAPNNPHAFALVRQPGGGVDPFDAPRDAKAGVFSPAAAWSANGRYVAVPAQPGMDASMIVWDVARREPDLLVGSSPAVWAALSDDGERILVVDEAGEAVLWDLTVARRRNAVRTWPPREVD